MPIINRIADFQDEMTGWRRHIHTHPETAFEEHKTSAFVAERLESFGIEVHRGLAGTGIVGKLVGGNGSGKAIGLRADMDALDVHEKNDFGHKSQHEGKMHACGHDGHTTMLLGAAKYLAETKNFDGTVYFIFQPAEENEGGGRVMVEEGLFDKFPVEQVYGMHNWPGLDVGKIAVRPGPMMASFDIFEITVKGKGAHGAMPHMGVDSVVTASQIVNALQTIASRNTHPLDAVVVSVTQIHGGDAYNVLPDEVVLRGTTRSFRPEVQDMIEPAMRRIVDGICQTMGATATVKYERRYPPTINTAAETEIAAGVAAEVVGDGNVHDDLMPSMGSEDFAFMLQKKPGSYVWIGNGSTEGGCMLHNPHYDFNDGVLPIGASYWAKLVETTLGKAA
ncbi:MAG: amidohydrolase [Alphaproteobacteria bacterium]|nr:amidohydrolase [Alphaproteobacteria bacterium]MBU0797701.1 amidohydrolase [Alphaproteobacteria bacterium]MBU0885906.1 amidohydrolase [Alphaproteobacteria bacterium]MBU1814594.1 amidohydrolase [Alphaproteobacteria bacterium]